MEAPWLQEGVWCKGERCGLPLWCEGVQIIKPTAGRPLRKCGGAVCA